jgi:hypothetical protein
MMWDMGQGPYVQNSLYTMGMNPSPAPYQMLGMGGAGQRTYGMPQGNTPPPNGMPDRVGLPVEELGNPVQGQPQQPNPFATTFGTDPNSTFWGMAGAQQPSMDQLMQMYPQLKVLQGLFRSV